MLWQSQIHEGRILAAYVGIPAQVTEEQMERWVLDFDSWDICDQCCSNLFCLTPQAYSKALQWSRRDPEFVKRAGYVLMAVLAVRDKKASNSQLEQFFSAILAGSTDRRNFVKKAVNWALRQTGKRNLDLNQKAIELAQEIQKLDSPAAHWIASDAIIELTSPAVRSKLDGQTSRGS
jgi:3-methyladenine DNA glycosylase AlkD